MIPKADAQSCILLLENMALSIVTGQTTVTTKPRLGFHWPFATLFLAKGNKMVANKNSYLFRHGGERESSFTVHFIHLGPI